MYSVRKLSRKNDRTVIRGEVDHKDQEMQRLHDLGEQFLSDKKELERQIENTEKSDLPPTLKKKLLTKLREDCTQLEKDYTEAVETPQEELQKEMQNDIYEMDDSIYEMNQIESELQNVKMKAASADIAAMYREVSVEQAAFEALRKDALDKLNTKMWLKEQQARNIRLKKLRR